MAMASSWALSLFRGALDGRGLLLVAGRVVVVDLVAESLGLRPARLRALRVLHVEVGVSGASEADGRDTRETTHEAFSEAISSVLAFFRFSKAFWLRTLQ